MQLEHLLVMDLRVFARKWVFDEVRKVKTDEVTQFGVWAVEIVIKEDVFVAGGKLTGCDEIVWGVVL